jgi:hypothetical protein
MESHSNYWFSSQQFRTELIERIQPTTSARNNVLAPGQLDLGSHLPTVFSKGTVSVLARGSKSTPLPVPCTRESGWIRLTERSRRSRYSKVTFLSRISDWVRFRPHRRRRSTSWHAASLSFTHETGQIFR